MRFRSVASLSLGALTLSTLTALASPAHAADWRTGWCRADEGLSVVVDYATATGPEVPAAGWDVRCVIGGVIETDDDALLRVAAFEAAGFEVQHSRGYITAINGIEEYANDDVTDWYFSGAAIGQAWDVGKHGIVANGANINKALGGALTMGFDYGPPRVATQFGDPEPAPDEDETPAAPQIVGSAGRINGTVIVGNKVTLSLGSWTTGVRLSYQWLRDGKPISGATSRSYTITAKDAGAALSVRTTGTMSGYVTASSTSPSVTVKKGTLSLRSITISGKGKIGKAVQARISGAKPGGVKISYTWLRNGKPIAGANKVRYTLKPADANRKIKVRIKASKAGFRSITKTSAAIRPKR